MNVGYVHFVCNGIMDQEEQETPQNKETVLVIVLLLLKTGVVR